MVTPAGRETAAGMVSEAEGETATEAVVAERNAKGGVSDESGTKEEAHQSVSAGVERNGEMAIAGVRRRMSII